MVNTASAIHAARTAFVDKRWGNLSTMTSSEKDKKKARQGLLPSTRPYCMLHCATGIGASRQRQRRQQRHRGRTAQLSRPYDSKLS